MRRQNTRERVQLLAPQTSVNCVIKEIASKQSDAFYVCDLSEIVKQHKTWIVAMPRVKPHFAVKANDHLPIIKVLAGLGCSFDCASKSELRKVLSVGVHPERIIFANPTKDPNHIKFAVENRVDLMTFDSETELYKIKNICPQARMVLRIRCDSSTAAIVMGSKHGCEPKEAPSLLKLARSMDINVIGVSFHVGTEIQDAPIYEKALATCRQVFDEAQKLGFRLSLVDIGGGYHGAKGTSIQPVADVVNSALNEYFPDLSVTIISEPGRFYVDSAFTLSCKIHSIRNISGIRPDLIKYMYYINDGVYNNFNHVITEKKQFKPRFLKNFGDCELYLSTIWGQTCDPLDQILNEAYLPKLNLGDWMVWDNMGAYSLTMNTPFNGYPKTKIHLVARNELKDILKKGFKLTYNISPGNRELSRITKH